MSQFAGNKHIFIVGGAGPGAAPARTDLQHSHLAKLHTAWPSLPLHVRRCIHAIVDAGASLSEEQAAEIIRGIEGQADERGERQPPRRLMPQKCGEDVAHRFAEAMNGAQQWFTVTPIVDGGEVELIVEIHGHFASHAQPLR